MSWHRRVLFLSGGRVTEKLRLVNPAVEEFPLAAFKSVRSPKDVHFRKAEAAQILADLRTVSWTQVTAERHLLQLSPLIVSEDRVRLACNACSLHNNVI